MNHRTEIDGLRGIAVLGVLIAHTNLGILPGGFLGVDVFFVISGFLITSIIQNELDRESFSILRFYQRRVRRIFPALILVLLVTTAFAYLFLYPKELVDYANSLVASSLFFSNFYFWGTEADYFATPSLYTPLLHTWSLSVEEQFYIAYPLLFLVINKFLKIKKVILISLLFVSLFIAHWSSNHFQTASYYFPITRAWELLAGGCIAQYLNNRQVLNINNTIQEALSMSGIVLIFWSFVFLDHSAKVPGFDAVAPVLGACLVLLYGDKTALANKLLSLRPLVIVGLISFSAYLWHQPVYSFARIYFVNTLHPIVYVLFLLAILFVSYFSWRFVEQPLRKNAGLNTGTIAIFVTSVLLIPALGVFITKNNGFEEFLGAEERAKFSEIENSHQKRLKNVRYDECHYNPSATKLTVEEFMDQWSCFGQGTAKGIIVFGDSNAADRAISLNLVDYNVGQLTGAGCSIDPVFMNKHCQYMFDKFKEKYGSELSGLILANRFNEYELSSYSVKSVMEYWSLNVPRVFFSSIPEFPRIKDQIVRRLTKSGSASKSNSNYIRDDFRSDQSFQLYQNHVSDKDLLIDTKKTVCNMHSRPNCAPIIDDQEILMTDSNHLSGLGAFLFGQEIGTTVSDFFGSH